MVAYQTKMNCPLAKKANQELVIEGDQQVSKKYGSKGSGPETGGDFQNEHPDNLPLMDIPVIDIGHLMNSSTCHAHQLERMRSGLSTWGCFQVDLKPN